MTRPSRTCGRPALGWAALFFVLGQLALVLIEQARPILRDPDYGHRAASLRAQCAASPDRPLLLVIGSSRVSTGIRPEILPGFSTADGRTPVIFNFGVPGAGPTQQLLYLRRLLAEGIRPTWLVVECWPPLLHRGSGDTE